MNKININSDCSISKFCQLIETFTPVEIYNNSFSSTSPLYFDIVYEDGQIKSYDTTGIGVRSCESNPEFFRKNLSGGNPRECYFKSDIGDLNSIFSDLFTNIAHGDQEHRIWLYEELFLFQENIFAPKIEEEMKKFLRVLIG